MQVGDMGRVTIKRDPQPAKTTKTVFVPMIVVDMRQDNGVNILPRGPDGAQPLLQSARPKAQIDQHAEAARTQQTCVASTPAAQDMETHGTSFYHKTLS